jgi:hypothetical protein
MSFPFLFLNIYEKEKTKLQSKFISKMIMVVECKLQILMNNFQIVKQCPNTGTKVKLVTTNVKFQFYIVIVSLFLIECASESNPVFERRIMVS